MVTHGDCIVLITTTDDVSDLAWDNVAKKKSASDDQDHKFMFIKKRKN